MNNYELTLILNTDLSSKFDEFQSKFDKTLSDIGFKVKKLEYRKKTACLQHFKS
mgnify:CR=1 FL=1